MTTGHDLRRSDDLPPLFEQLLRIAAEAVAARHTGRLDGLWQAVDQYLEHTSQEP